MSIIKKCLDELDKIEPRLDYLRGMLETYYELSGERAKDTVPPGGMTLTPPTYRVEAMPLTTKPVFTDVPQSTPLEVVKALADKSRE